MAPKPSSYVEYLWLWRIYEFKQKSAQDSTFAIFGWSETRAKSLLLLKNRLLIRISENLKEQKSNDKLLFDEKQASRSTFAPQKGIKIKKAKNRTRSLKLAENQAETRKWWFLNPFWTSKCTKKHVFIVLRSLKCRKYRTNRPKVAIYDPKFAPKRGFLFEFWSFRPFFAQKSASRSSFARVTPKNLHEKPNPTRCTIPR